MFPTSRQRQSGFTLAEMMIAVAILAIGLGMALPRFQRAIATQRLTASGNEILGVLHYARMEAVRLRARVVACPTQGGSSCDGGSNWTKAIVFSDTNRDGSRGSGEEILRRWDYAGTTLSMSQDAGANPARMVFGGSGLSRSGGAAMTRVRICSSGVDDVSSVLSLEAGGAHVQKESSDACAD